jgi:hypothetical protein
VTSDHDIAQGSRGDRFVFGNRPATPEPAAETLTSGLAGLDKGHSAPARGKHQAWLELEDYLSAPNSEVVRAIKKPPREISANSLLRRELPMSQVKRDMGRIEALHYQAVEVALQAKALKKCSFPGHSDWLLDQGDDEANRLAYVIGTNRWRNGEIDGEREEFLNAIRHAIKSAPYDCPRCDRMMAKD